MRTEFNHAANDSPRSGSNKKIAPIVFAAIMLVAVAVTIWLKSPYVQGMTLALGLSAVALVLSRFSRQREPLG